jgi:hypothetical protein
MLSGCPYKPTSTTQLHRDLFLLRAQHAGGRDFHPVEASRSKDDLITRQTGGIFQRRSNMVARKLRVGTKDLFGGLAGRKLLQNEVNRNSGPLQTRFPRHYIGADLNILGQFHIVQLYQRTNGNNVKNGRSATRFSQN